MSKSLATLNVKIAAQLQGFEKALNGIERKMGRFQRKFERMGANMTQAITLPIVGMGAAGVTAFGKLEDLTSRLTVAFNGNRDAAQGALDVLKRFAQETKQPVEEVVDSFLKLKNLGLDPSEAALLSYGNTAAAMGKSLNQMIEAVADASVGEFERLKEFGIKAKSQGDQVSFTFQGVTKTVGKNSAEIQQYLMDIGQTQFAGSLDAQANNVNGIFRGMRDSIFISLGTLGEEIAKALDLKTVAKNVSEKIQQITAWFSALDDQTKQNIVRFGLIVAAIGPVLMIVAKLTSVAMLAVSGFKSLASGVMLALKAIAFVISPIGIATTALIGIAAAAMYTYKNWDGLKERFSNISWWKNALIDMVQFLNKYNPFSGLIKGYNALADKLNMSKIVDPFKMVNDQLELLKDNVSYTTPLKTFGETVKEVGADLMELAGIKLPTFDMAAPAAPDFDLSSGSSAGGSTGGSAVSSVSVSESALDKLQKQLTTIDAKAAAFGDTLTTVYQDKADAVKSVIDSMIESGEGSGPVFDMLLERYQEFSDGPLSSLKTGFDEAAISAEKMTAKVTEGVKPLQEVAMTFAHSFAQMAESGASSMADLASATVSAARKIIAAKIKEGIAAAIGQKMAAGPFGILLAAGAGIAANAIFNRVLGAVKVPAFAEGGAVSGPMQALVGDNPNAKSDPELIMPFSKMRKMVLKDIIPKVNLKDTAAAMQRIAIDPVKVAMQPINLGITGRQIRILLEQENNYTAAIR